MSVELDGANNTVKTDTISEITSANGITIDGLSIKDSKLVTANSVIEANMSANSVDSDSYVDGSIDTAHIADLNVTTGKIAADAITGAKIADDAINSEHYTDGSIDTAHLADGQVTIGKLATAVLTGATDIGAAIVDADLFLVDDGAGGTLRKTTAARIKTYAGGATRMNELTDVSMDITNFVDSLLIQPNSNGSAPTTGTLSSATNNVGIGKDVFKALTTGQENTVIGATAGQSLTEGNASVYIGLNAGGTITTGTRNICIGRGAGDGYDTEVDNVAIGFDALGGAVAGGEQNTIVGNYSGDAITSGDNNTCLGHNTGSAITTASANTYIGFSAGGPTTTGGSNICIGSQAVVNSSDSLNEIVLGIGITGADNDFVFGKASNVVSNDFDADANWSRSSDVRKKREIYDQELGLDFINDLRTVRFQWKPSNEFPKEWNDYSEENNMDTDVIMHGFIAQEVKSSLDKHASNNDIKFSGWKEGEDGMQHTSREMFVIPLIKAVQELTARVKELEAK